MALFGICHLSLNQVPQHSLENFSVAYVGPGTIMLITAVNTLPVLHTPRTSLLSDFYVPILPYIHYSSNPLKLTIDHRKSYKCIVRYYMQSEIFPKKSSHALQLSMNWFGKSGAITMVLLSSLENVYTTLQYPS